MPSNSGEINIDQIKILVILECKWNTFSSSVVGIVIALANGELRRIFETRENEADHYVTRTACDSVLLG
jgi:hypothetical protein